MFPPLATDSALYAYLGECIQATLTGKTKIEHLFDEERGTQIDFFYNLLLDWMGPGRDPAFLARTLLADGRFPCKFMVSLNRSDSIDVYKDVQAIWRGRPWVERYAGRGPSASFLSRGLLDKEEGETFVTIVATMEPNFRTVLLGELATPWPALPSIGPLHYCPGCWVEPRGAR